MSVVQCPHCHHVFDPDQRDGAAMPPFSPVALRILLTMPERFRRGQVCSVRQIATPTGYSESHIRRGLIELMRAGYVRRTPYGRAGRYQFAGVPSRLIPIRDRINLVIV